MIVGGISGAGITTYLEDYRPIFMVLTFGFLGFAFYLIYLPQGTRANDDRSTVPASTIMTFNKVMLWAVTLVVIVSLFFPQATSSLLATRDKFTKDMDQTVIRIEGMT